MADIPPYGPVGGQFYPIAAVKAPKRRPEDSDQDLKSTCAQMESLFLNHLLQKMRSTIEKTDLFGGGRSEEMYTSMLDGEIAKNLAEAGGIGLAKVLQQQLAAAGRTSHRDKKSDQGPNVPVRQAENSAPLGQVHAPRTIAEFIKVSGTLADITSDD